MPEFQGFRVIKLPQRDENQRLLLPICRLATGENSWIAPLLPQRSPTVLFTTPMSLFWTDPVIERGQNRLSKKIWEHPQHPSFRTPKPDLL